MAQAWKIRLPNGVTVRPGEWTSTPLYSTVEIDDGSIGTLKGFSYGIGGDVPGSDGPRRSNIGDTNLQGSGNVLAENEELLLYSLQIECFTMTGTSNDLTTAFTNADPPDMSALNMVRIQRDTIVVMKIANTKEYSREVFGWFPAATGVHNTFGAAVADAPDVGPNTEPLLIGNNGGVNVWDNREFATPHHVAPGEAFEVALMFPSGSVSGLDLESISTARIRCRIFAAGYRKRPVA